MNYFVFCLGIAAALLAVIAVRMTKTARDKKKDEDLSFASSIANEIHTPLTYAIARLEDIIKDKEISARTKADVRKIQAKLKGLASYTGNIIEFRKNRIFKDTELSVKYIDLSLFLEKMALAFEFRFNSKHVQLIKEIQADVLLWADISILQHIIHLILGNTINHSSETIIKIILHRTGNKAFIDITESYGQTDEICHESINIQLARQLCKIHKIGFDVKCKSSTETIYSLKFNTDEEFPDALREEVPESIEIPEHNEKLPSILLVEDSYETCRYLEDSFYRDFSLICASNAKEGLELTHKHKPDLIISAVLLPGINGIEFCRVIKNDPLTENIPFMFYTGIDASEVRAEAYHAGADSYIVKPTDNAVLKERIYNMLDRVHKLMQKNIGCGGVRISTLHNKDEHDIIERFSRIVEENLSAESMDVEFIAKEMAMSQSTLYRRIKSASGISPVEMIKHIRLDKAARLLAETDKTITEISWLVGINSTVYFRNCFKERFGKTPTLYREEIRSGE